MLGCVQVLRVRASFHSFQPNLLPRNSSLRRPKNPPQQPCMYQERKAGLRAWCCKSRFAALSVRQSRHKLQNPMMPKAKSNETEWVSIEVLVCLLLHIIISSILASVLGCNASTAHRPILEPVGYALADAPINRSSLGASFDPGLQDDGAIKQHQPAQISPSDP